MDEPSVSQPTAHPRPGAAIPPWAPFRSSRPRIWLRGTMLLATAITLALAGGLFWGALDVEIRRLSDLVDPGILWRAGVVGLPYALWTLAILLAHELGHYLACQRYGIPATLPFFVPGPPPLGTFGAVIRIRGRIPNRKALFDVAAAGPLAGFAVALPAFVLGVILAEPAPGPVPPGALSIGLPLLWKLIQPLWTHATPPLVNPLLGAGWVGMLVTSLNLFPAGQLDGGHAAYAVSRSLHRVLAYATIGALLGLVVFHVHQGRTPAYLVWLAVLVWMRDRHPRLVDESVPLGALRTGLALLLIVLFALAFIPEPLVVRGE